MQQGQRLAQHRRLHLGFLVALLRLFQQLRHALFEAFEVGEHQLGLDRFGVFHRVHLAGHVRHIIIDKAAQHVGDGVGLADVGEELVSQPFAFGRALHQAGDIGEAQLRLDDLLALGDGGQLVDARVRHGHVAHVRFDRAKRIIGRLCRRRLRERIEQGGFADIGQADDTDADGHDVIPDRKMGWRSLGRERQGCNRSAMSDK